MCIRDRIKIESPNFNVDFDFDNSKSYSDDGSVSSNLLELYIRRKGESDIKYINGVEIQDTKGFLWKIDDEDIYAYCLLYTSNQGIAGSSWAPTPTRSCKISNIVSHRLQTVSAATKIERSVNSCLLYTSRCV